MANELILIVEDSEKNRKLVRESMSIDRTKALVTKHPFSAVPPAPA